MTVKVTVSPTFGVELLTALSTARSAAPKATGVPPALAKSTQACSLANGLPGVDPSAFQPSLRHGRAALTITCPPWARYEVHAPALENGSPDRVNESIQPFFWHTRAPPEFPG